METLTYEQRRALEIEHEAKQSRALEILCREIASLMPDWSIRVNSENIYGRIVLVKDGMSIYLSRDGQKKDRLNVGTWGWPSYTMWDDRGQESKAIISPLDLWEPKEESPSISVAIDRGAETIARSIQQRFLPEYERIYRRCLERAIDNAANQIRSREMWLEACRIAGVPPKYNSVTIKTKHGNLELEKRYSTLQVTMDIGLETLQLIIDALNR